MSNPDQLVFPIVVWGEKYLETFTKLALPTFLASGNIPYCASRLKTRLIIITDEDGAAFLESAEEFKFARETCEVEVRSEVRLPTSTVMNKYALMAAAHHSVIKELQGSHSIVGILSPDCLISDGTLGRSLDWVVSGFSAVLAPGPRAGLQGVMRSLRDKVVGGRLSISSARLVSLLCENFHPISQSVFYNARKLSTMPSCLYWSASRHSFVARYFHLHPLMVHIYPEVTFPEEHQGTVDASLIDDAEVSLDDCYVCVDSDEVCIVEVTDEAVSHIPSKRVFFRNLFIFSWSKFWTRPRHVKAFLRYVFLFKGDDAPLDNAIKLSKRNLRLLDWLLRRGTR